MGPRQISWRAFPQRRCGWKPHLPFRLGLSGAVRKESLWELYRVRYSLTRWISIAFAVRSVDHSLSNRLITYRLSAVMACVSMHPVGFCGLPAQRCMSFQIWTMPTTFPPTSSASRPPQDIGIRAVGFGILLIPLNVYWIVRLEVVGFSYPTLVVPFTNVIFLFFILLLLNLASGKFIERRFLSPGALITIYVMLNISSAIASTDMLQVLVSTMGHAFYFATPENEWKEHFWDHLPRWLVVHDKATLEGYYNGGTSLYAWQNVKAWLLPAFVWLCFIVVLIFMMICLCCILRRQWTGQEKLTYPVIRLPPEMSEQRVLEYFLMSWIWRP
ncbi:MAG: hypothetical protein OXN17_04705 [Candidatus Poribacteria bacterium]|nr:hypothetical protein [Candidatus Poribacteria bacterium]MDE0506950.1 hypothetical protein [Candidatus Poribacteria bacterium]